MDQSGETKHLSDSSLIRWLSIEGVDGEVLITFVFIFVASIAFVSKLINYIILWWEATRNHDDALIQQPPQPSFNRSEEPCPVCFCNISFAIETGCYHLFCGTCILGLIQYARHRNITCPVCRSQVLMLYPVFSNDEYHHERNSSTGRTRENLITEIQEYNHLFSGGNRTLVRTIFELPIYIRRLWRSFNNPNDVLVQNRMKTLLYLILFLVALYILFPFDLFPEVYFGILGFLDDFLVLAMSLLYLTSVYRSLFFDLENHH